MCIDYTYESIKWMNISHKIAICVIKLFGVPGSGSVSGYGSGQRFSCRLHGPIVVTMCMSNVSRAL